MGKQVWLILLSGAGALLGLSQQSLPPRPSRELIYVQRLTHRSVVVAWGGPAGNRQNTIGESSPSFGPAELQVFFLNSGQPVPGSPFRASERNWIEAALPKPSTTYGYDLMVNGRPWGDPIYRRERLLRFTTFPDPEKPSDRLSFMVVGDFGTGGRGQMALAEVMRRLVEEREREGKPIRFVITTGDNVYDEFLFWGTGSDDRKYYPKFFLPYQRILSRIPFFPALGNHDGSESESREDLDHYRDNFFLPPAILPGGRPSRFPDRFYALSFGRDVRLFCLDTTANEETLPGSVWEPIYRDRGRSEQRQWLTTELERARKALWKIAWFHHPPYNAGKKHYGSGKAGNLVELERNLVPVLAGAGVRVAFNGHAHNFQITRQEQEGPLRETRYVLSAGGGKWAGGQSDLDVMRRERIQAANARNECGFLLVEIDSEWMSILPLSVETGSGRAVPLAIRDVMGVVYPVAAPSRSRRPSPSQAPSSTAEGTGQLSPYHPILIRATPES